MYEHKSGLPFTHDRATGRNDVQGVVFMGDGRLLQSAELNELQTVERERARRISRVTMKDGDRIEGAAIVLIDEEAGTWTLTAGKIYVDGDIFPVAQAVISDVPMTGQARIGVEVTRQWVTSLTDPSLLGLAAGALSEGEPGAAREVVTIAWALIGEEEGEFVPVYLIQDGTVIDQTPPPGLSGVNQAIAVYDRDANGNYIVRGCRVTALGKVGGSQLFSIEEGVANIQGFKRTRQAALRHAELEDWDTEEVAGEPHTYPGGASATIQTNFSPISAINTVLVTKEVTENVTRGAVGGTADLLAQNSVTEILEVKQGATTYVVTTDYLRVGDSVSWSPGGAEPATGSTYQVKYRYLASVSQDAATDSSITVSGGVAGTTVIFGYDYKLPRIDLLCLDQEGLPVYVKGVSARKNPLEPVAPAALLKLCVIRNNWMTKPDVENDGTRSVPYDEAWRFYNAVLDLNRLMQIERINRAIDAREPVAKLGTFADPLTGDEFRDQGEVQTASVGLGTIELAILPTFFTSTLAAPVMLDYTEEVVIEQSLDTGCMKINPYQNFTPMPASMKIVPPADFWTVKQTEWASPQTIEFNRGIRRDNGPLVVSTDSTRVVDQRQEQAEFLRPISVSYTIKGFGVGEILDVLTFDGINVHPGGTVVGDEDGEIAGSFTIPANVTAGTKELYAEGQGGSFASAPFVGQGVINTTIMRTVTTIERWTRPPTEVVRVPSSTFNPFREDNHGPDPLAQTFTLPAMRHLVGVDVKLCDVGSTANGLLVEQVVVETGMPTTEVEASAFVSMAGAVDGWKSARYPMPVVTSGDRESAFVVKTDDADHALAFASLGAFDTARQSFVTAQPYTVGVMLSSSNASTWTAHQNDDLAFRVVAAKFGPLEKTVALGTFDLVDCSDLQVRATIDLPSQDCSVVFEIVRADASVIRLLPYQVVQLTEYISETVTLRAILKGTATLSPVLFNPVVLVAGEIATEATYVCRALKLGTSVDLTAYLKASLPFGSTLTVQYDKADDTWLSLPLISTEALSDPAWVEQKRGVTNITATEGRIKITLTGGPSARPRVGDLGAAIM
ncbi:virulence protein [Rhizobium sp. R634]|uniref:DUF4815 domain-containing protein n=1 Tax=Rhizobium sp. R634 TaxID=1764274 RepID=UPI000B5337A3|nr:DUF4815 domain-containing protein [Rhizobium sp. R634]OWV79570.1 virulence protein [Rhizobium sp. R634]